MACMTLLAPPVAMATTQLARVIRYEVSAPWQEQNTECQPLRMSWVVVTGAADSASNGWQMGTAEIAKSVCNIPLMSPA
ncbi:MAG: hypothetical protein ACLP56_15460 [Candidatus Sulfotelmatobacter sp.]